MDAAHYAEETPRLQFVAVEVYGDKKFAKFFDITRDANSNALCLVKPQEGSEELCEPIIEFSSLHREDRGFIGVARDGSDYLIERDEDEYKLTEIPR